MKTIYGPVSSWRLGKSLGIDLICKKKVCSFDCVYCQLGLTTEKTVERKTFVPIELVAQELKEVQRDFEGMNFVSVYEAKRPEVRKTVGLKKLRVLKRAK